MMKKTTADSKSIGKKTGYIRDLVVNSIREKVA